MAGKNKKKKSLIKRIFKWTGITFLLLLIAVIVLPFLFKDQLVAIAKKEANKSLNAKVDFGEFDLALFSTFPNFSFSINNVTVDGVDHFEGTRLAEIKNTVITLDLMSVISGDEIEIVKVAINEPTFNVKVDKEGFANYDIAKSDSTALSVVDTVKTEEGEPIEYAIGIQEVTISKANIKYEDVPGDLYADIKNLDFTLTGDFTQDIIDAKTKTNMESVSVETGGVGYLRKDKINLVADVTIDQLKKYTLKENNLKINELDLGFDGWLELKDEDAIGMDMTFKAKQTSFKNILSLVPAVYLTDFKNVRTSGNLALGGDLKGEMKGESLPAFNLNLLVSNGYFKYPELSNAVENINIKTNVSHPQGVLNKMKINVSKFHMDLANNPIDLDLILTSPIVDPTISSNVVAKIDLEKLETVIPMNNGENYKGKINADLHAAGKLSSIEKEEYQDFKANGSLMVEDILYQSPELNYDVLVNKMDMMFTPQYVDLKTFNSKIGKSDIAANGKIDNILLYLFNDEALKGNFKLTSNKLDIDELMSTSLKQTSADIETAAKPIENEDESGVFEVPANFDMMLNTDIKEVVYDGLPIKNIKGMIGVKEQVATMNNVSMNTMGGQVMLNGSYNTQKITPVVDFKYNIKEIQVQDVVQYFSSVETLAPILKRCKGKISTNMELMTSLDQNMSPIYNTINGLGGLSSKSLTIAGVKVLDKLADVLKVKDLSSQTMKNVNMNFLFEDGKAIVKPFDTKLSGMKTNISGYTGFDQNIKYDLAMEVPKAKLGGAANDVMASLLGKVNSKGLDVSIPDLIPVKVTIGGTVTNPKLETNLKGQATNLVNNVKEKVLDTIKKTFNKEIDKILGDAQAQADKIRANAKVQADKLREEGRKATEKAKAEAAKLADQVKAQAYEAADDVEESAKSPLEKLAKKKLAESMRKKADDAYQKAINKANEKATIPQSQANSKAEALESEADKRANQLMENAQIRADKLKQ